MWNQIEVGDYLNKFNTYSAKQSLEQDSLVLPKFGSQKVLTQIF